MIWYIQVSILEVTNIPLLYFLNYGMTEIQHQHTAQTSVIILVWQYLTQVLNIKELYRIDMKNIYTKYISDQNDQVQSFKNCYFLMKGQCNKIITSALVSNNLSLKQYIICSSIYLRTFIKVFILKTSWPFKNHKRLFSIEIHWCKNKLKHSYKGFVKELV